MPKNAACAAICLLAVLAVGGAGSQDADSGKNGANGKNGEKSPTTQPAASQPAQPQSNLEYWLSQAVPATTQPDTQTRADDQGTNPLARRDRSFRRDALPGVVELSDGRQLAGALYTTREKPWLVFVEKEKRWRRIPFVTALSITAVVVSQEMALQWRWKAMGEPERVYTGKKFPTRRFLWTFRLIDGSTITGGVKGQPIWVRRGQQTTGPMVLHERSKGKVGQALADLVYVRRVIVSADMRDAVLADQARMPPAP